MPNLLKETIEILAANNKTPDNVRFVQTSAIDCMKPGKLDPPPATGSWSDFAALADFDYHNGYGGAEIDTSLKIVGDDWWLERGEYDGSEWWEFKTLPARPEPSVPLTLEHIKDHW